MPLKVREDQHRIVVDDVAAHRNFLEVLAAFNGQIHRSLSVHDVNRAEGPAVDFKGLEVILGGVAVAVIERVGLDNRALRDTCLQGLHHFARQDVGTVTLAGMELNGDLARQIVLDQVVEFIQVIRVDHG